MSRSQAGWTRLLLKYVQLRPRQSPVLGRFSMGPDGRANAASFGLGRRYNSEFAQISRTPQQGMIPVWTWIITNLWLTIVSMMSSGGPIARYKQLVEMGRLREDSHQKGNSIRLIWKLISAVVGVLQKLYQDLLAYKPHEVVDQKISRATGSPVLLWLYCIWC